MRSIIVCRSGFQVNFECSNVGKVLRDLVFLVLLASSKLRSEGTSTCTYTIYRANLVCTSVQKLIFTQIQCPVRSKLVSNVNCYLENDNALAVEVTTNNENIPSIVGMATLNLYISGRKNVMHLNGFRLEICKVLGATTKPSMVTFLYSGIQKTENNLHQCPFKRVWHLLNI